MRLPVSWGSKWSQLDMWYWAFMYIIWYVDMSKMNCKKWPLPSKGLQVWSRYKHSREKLSQMMSSIWYVQKNVRPKLSSPREVCPLQCGHGDFPEWPCHRWPIKMTRRLLGKEDSQRDKDQPFPWAEEHFCQLYLFIAALLQLACFSLMPTPCHSYGLLIHTKE